MPIGDGSPVTMNVGDNVTAASNTTITIRCPVSGVPTPSVTWHKDGIPIFKQDRVTFTADNNSLVIDLAMVADSAKYTCRVQSVFGMDEVSSQVTITGNLIAHLYKISRILRALKLFLMKIAKLTKSKRLCRLK